MKLGDKFELKCGNTAKVSELFSQGFNYHTLDKDGNCIAAMKYCLKSNIGLIRV